MKKILLGLGTVATIVAPIAAIVSCTFEKGTKSKAGEPEGKKPVIESEFTDVENISSDAYQVIEFKSLGEEIKGADKAELLTGKEIVKTELNSDDNQIRFTYDDENDVLQHNSLGNDVLVDESEDETEDEPIEFAYSIRITIQLGENPEIIKIERIRNIINSIGDINGPVDSGNPSIEDITKDKTASFDESKVKTIFKEFKIPEVVQVENHEAKTQSVKETPSEVIHEKDPEIFKNLEEFPNSVDKSLMFDSLGNGIKNIETGNLLKDKLISKIELDLIDQKVRFTYESASSTKNQNEENTYPSIRLTIQLGKNSGITKIEGFSDLNGEIHDITDSKKSNFDGNKVTDVITNRTFEDYPTDGLHVLDQNKRMNPLYIKDRDNEEASCKHVDLSQDSLDLAKVIRKLMNEEDDPQWHTYGDGIIDGANAVRLAILNDIKGDKTLKILLRKFADEPFAKWRTPRDFSNGNQYEEFCKMQINDWFDSDAEMPNLIGDWHFWAEMGKAGKANDWKGMKKAFRPEHVEKITATNYRALRPSTSEILTTQHRAQEFDWLGNFDGHGHAATIKKINNHEETFGNYNTGDYARAPKGDEGMGAENYVFNYTYNEHKFSDGVDFTGGLLSAIDVLYDYADGGRETGHRTNLFGVQWSTFGWAWTADNRSNWHYMVTRAGQGSTLPVTGAEDIKAKNPFLNKYSIEMLKYVPPMDYLYRTCEWDKNNYFALPGGWRSIFGSKIYDVFHTQHNSMKDLWDDVVAVIGDGNAKNTRFFEPTSMPEVPRVAQPQKVGRPDQWTHSYDYNGGGSITGHQYGYSPIDETLFEVE